MQSDVIFSTVYLQFLGNKKQSDDDTPPPAKRGRKPKDATTPATSNPKESEPTNTTSTPKSPRGRKRKTEEKSNEELSKRPEDSGITIRLYCLSVCFDIKKNSSLNYNMFFIQIKPNPAMVCPQELKIETFHVCQTLMRLVAHNEKLW